MAISQVDITPGSNHSGVTRLAGFSFYEDGASTALIHLRKGSVSGQILFSIPLTASAGATLMLPEHIVCEDGVYVQEASGSITGVLHAG